MSGAENTVPPVEAASALPPPQRQRGFLEVIERVGNLLPDPMIIFIYLIFVLMIVSAIGAAMAWSASLSYPGEWSALSPVVVPMFMLLGISPEMTTAAYRMGDSYTNIMTPLISYFPLILAFSQRWDRTMGVGSLLALMLPYALIFKAVGIAMTVGWAAFDLPLGPGAQVYLATPAGASTQ